MINIKKIFENKGLLQLNLWQSALFLLIASIGLCFAMLWIQPIGLVDVAEIVKKTKGLVFLLNWLPILIIMFMLFFMGLNATSSAAIAGFFGIALSFLNRTKILIRNDPLLPWDISLGGEVTGVAKSFGSATVGLVIAAVLVYIIVAAIASLLIQSEKLSLKFKSIGFIAMAASIMLINKPLYKNTELNNNLYVIGNVYNQVATFNSKGFLYSFIYSYNTNKISKPDDYDTRGVIAKIDAFEPLTDASVADIKKPHIIMVMGEAFSEFSLNPNFDFTGYTDPLYNYKKIKENSYYGQIVVPNIGGGTADTEFDVLTGLSTRHLRGAPFAFRLVGGDFDSIAHSLNSLGYNSEFIHPGHSWFYNRQNVYAYMGFSRMVFMDEFKDANEKGMYIAEDATIERMIEMFENHLNENPATPYFQYCVTIQNHGPYKDKYLVDTNFNTTLDISDDDINAISNYYEGLHDADRELKRLTDYFESSREPVVLIYFGDHLPAYASSVYNAAYPNEYDAGSIGDLTRLYKTPFIIWENSEAKSLNLNTPDFGEGSENHIFSSNYLGAFLLEYLGFENLSPFTDYLNELRREFPVIMEHQSFTPDGIPSTELSDEQREKLILYRNWEFYKIFDE